MFEILRSKLNHTSAMPHFLSLLHHCLLLPLDYGSSPQHWLLFDRIVQQVRRKSWSRKLRNINFDLLILQVVLQNESQENPDIAAISINVKEIIELLAQEEEVLAAKSRAEELEKENGELAGNLAKREQELDLKHQEKEDLEANLARTKEKLETEKQNGLSTLKQMEAQRMDHQKLQQDADLVTKERNEAVARLGQEMAHLERLEREKREMMARLDSLSKV